MVHMRGTLGDGMQRISRDIDRCFFKRGVPKRQWIEIGLNPFLQFRRRLAFTMTLRSQSKFLQGFGVELQDDLIRGRD